MTPPPQPPQPRPRPSAFRTILEVAILIAFLCLCSVGLGGGGGGSGSGTKTGAAPAPSTTTTTTPMATGLNSRPRPTSPRSILLVGLVESLSALIAPDDPITPTDEDQMIAAGEGPDTDFYYDDNVERIRRRRRTVLRSVQQICAFYGQLSTIGGEGGGRSGVTVWITYREEGRVGGGGDINGARAKTGASKSEPRKTDIFTSPRSLIEKRLLEAGCRVVLENESDVARATAEPGSSDGSKEQVGLGQGGGGGGSGRGGRVRNKRAVGGITSAGEDPTLPPNPSRYARLATLRSEQRRRVIAGAAEKAEKEGGSYDVVANVDFDLLSLSPLGRFVKAVEMVAPRSDVGDGDDGNTENEKKAQEVKKKEGRDAGRMGAAAGRSGSGNGGSRSAKIVCANGYESWFSREYGPRLYYDTLGSIDDMGRWYYQSYSRSPFQVLTFGQRRLFRRIRDYGKDNEKKRISGGRRKNKKTDKEGVESDDDLRSDDDALWPMRSCFGGLALYDWLTFSASECDYDRSKITLGAVGGDEPIGNNNKDSAVAATAAAAASVWQFPAEYTLSGTTDGDACEHAVFQLCLGELSRQQRQEQQRGNVGEGAGEASAAANLVIGIMSDLIVGRKANILSTGEAKAGVAKGAAMLVVLVGAAAFWNVRRRNREMAILRKKAKDLK